MFQAFPDFPQEIAPFSQSETETGYLLGFLLFIFHSRVYIFLHTYLVVIVALNRFPKLLMVGLNRFFPKFQLFQQFPRMLPEIVPFSQPWYQYGEVDDENSKSQALQHRQSRVECKHNCDGWPYKNCRVSTTVNPSILEWI